MAVKENLEGLPVLSGMLPEGIAALMPDLPRFRAVQIFKWIASGAASFAEMNNLPLRERKELADRFILRPPSIHEAFCGEDGTVKLAIEFSDGARIESVLLSDQAGRRTACLSTQAGCPAGCVFCKTGAGFRRNLSSAEIIEQFLLLKDSVLKSAGEAENSAHPISNIVIMGMGEPFLNWGEVRNALLAISCGRGMNFSLRRITVSTCGIADGIYALADECPVTRLALSLTTADEALRRRLMPIAEGQPLRKLKEALSYFQKKGGGRVTLEAVLLGGINTRDEDARAMAEFAAGLDTVVNLIPWNTVKGLEFEGKPLRQPTASEAADFTRRLEAFDLKVTRRLRRGRGILGACGQLSPS
jgi:23S rRNA (adenine2503-C2)-methyltransferase